ncbi:TorD/DmsD family molecular chaperone [Desulfogranum mediterraneum]|uniref:TorD/DmsD family molecular chaperone n=1 Tax=Desulfogranum mediterraneum TaxID=160661 RepID=UPI000413D3BE|nr:molecular chaperone TorD family protein [Desulfogranum mediterraneum]
MTSPHPLPPAEPAEEAVLLSDVYSFLALSMRYPDAHFLDDQFLEAFAALLESLELKPQLEEFLLWRADSADPLEELQLEYTRLFINSVPCSTVPPYASVYLDGDRTIQGKTTEKTKDFYLSCGFDVIDSTEPPDHLQHELDFLAALTRESRFEEEELFLATLFRPWFAQFFEKCMHEARHPFYRVSIQLIDFFTKEEQ